MPTIEMLTECVEPVDATSMVSAILLRLQQEPDTLVLPVVRDNRPIGLIDRCDFLMKLASPLGHSLYGSRVITHIMDPEPAVVEYDTRIDAFSKVILKSRAGTMMRGFIVTRHGLYQGVGTAISLLRAVNDSQYEQIKSHKNDAAQLIAQQSELAKAADTTDRYLTVLNRELRTPLNGVLAVAVPLKQQPLNEAARAHVQTIIDSAECQLTILQDSLDLARAEAGDFELATEPTVVQGLMDRVEAQWTPRASEDGVSLIVSYDGAPDLVAIMDSARLIQVFNSLIGQALKYARSGMVEVSLKARKQDDQVILQARVRDDGPGISANDLESLFDANASSQTGTLGLAISHHIISQLKGRVWAENNAGSGSTFAFDLGLPLGVIEPEQVSKVAKLDQYELQSRPHVLIADDNGTNRIVAQALCEMFGCTSETVEDGQEALEAVTSRHFDLALMDINMPRLDGVQATLAIRRLGGTAGRLPIVALTANADPEDTQHYLEVGMASVVEKPIKPERLRMAINAALAAPTAPDITEEASSRRAG